VRLHSKDDQQTATCTRERDKQEDAQATQTREIALQTTKRIKH